MIRELGVVVVQPKVGERFGDRRSSAATSPVPLEEHSDLGRITTETPGDEVVVKFFGPG